MKLKLFAAVAIIEVAAVALDWTALQWLTKPLLAPLLLLHIYKKADKSLAAALVFATLGDIALLIPGTPAFLAGMGFFLGTQLCLLTAFLKRARPPLAAVLGYAVLWAGVNALLWSRLGDLWVPVLVYSLALTAMAAAATGVSRRTAAGGALFLLSDLMIGAGAAGIELPAAGVLVMTTYAAALALIVTGSVPGPAHRLDSHEMSSPAR
ncbi:lysoplasmalogenase [Actinoplanes awajinensis]|uniref:Lysoplasmalogenase n=1 Tax=Actinoplanes awajinensis subsp. mycoplanecinus TaxID=135947 RepID=A0A117MPW9_9ACTN|nr:lysoplasmalogenase [Actinoplanes awajinensis]KUL29292.1 hypothetical protein ADL15_29505 [Actinoplanes awajinensis subsp. mycoplanecinus]